MHVNIQISSTYEIFRQVAGGPSKASGMRKDAVVPELDRNGVSYFTRRLAVGDFVWIARENCSPHREIVLDFIIERKRMDDLASSICDGRFREQKHRMKQSGLGHVIYLIEEYGARLTFGNMPDASLRQVHIYFLDNEFFDCHGQVGLSTLLWPT